MGLTSINHTSFTVADVEGTAKWYCDMLGFEMVSDAMRHREFTEKVTGIPGSELHIIYVKGGGYHIELVQYVGSPGEKIDTATNNPGSAHIAYNVEGLAEMYADLAAKGIKFMGPPVEIPAGPNKGGLVVYLEDPEGNSLEFIQPPAR